MSSLALPRLRRRRWKPPSPLTCWIVVLILCLIVYIAFDVYVLVAVRDIRVTALAVPCLLWGLYMLTDSIHMLVLSWRNDQR